MIPGSTCHTVEESRKKNNKTEKKNTFIRCCQPISFWLCLVLDCRTSVVRRISYTNSSPLLLILFIHILYAFAEEFVNVFNFLFRNKEKNKSSADFSWCSHFFFASKILPHFIYILLPGVERIQNIFRIFIPFILAHWDLAIGSVSKFCCHRVASYDIQRVYGIWCFVSVLVLYGFLFILLFVFGWLKSASCNVNEHIAHYIHGLIDQLWQRAQ